VQRVELPFAEIQFVSSFIITYDLVAIPWLIREIGQREGRFVLWEVGLGLLFPHLADCPRGAQKPGVLRVLRELLFGFVSIGRVGGFCFQGVGRTVRLGR
jgi:hypothetical protein